MGRETKSQLPDTFYVAGNLIDDPVDIADSFINYFYNIGSLLGDKFELDGGFCEYLNDDIVTVFHSNPVSNIEITEIVN